MTGTTDRYNRSIALFGDEGQRRMVSKSIAIVGAGGVGCWAVYQTALLGVHTISIIDPEDLAETDRNRSGIAKHTDLVPGSRKVDLAARLVHEINPAITIHKVPHSLMSEEAFAAVIASDLVFGCVDKDGVRFVLNELALAYSKPFIDIATDVPEPGVYGGRVFFGVPGDACLTCMNLLDPEDVRRFLLSESERAAEDRLYGVPKRNLNRTGPAVVTLNMAAAGLAGTEFMVWATGMRAPNRLLTYHANRSVVTVSRDQPRPDCYYCKIVHGQGDAANVQRYLNHGAERVAA